MNKNFTKVRKNQKSCNDINVALGFAHETLESKDASGRQMWQGGTHRYHARVDLSSQSPHAIHGKLTIPKKSQRRKPRFLLPEDFKPMGQETAPIEALFSVGLFSFLRDHFGRWRR